MIGKVNKIRTVSAVAALLMLTGCGTIESVAHFDKGVVQTTTIIMVADKAYENDEVMKQALAGKKLADLPHNQAQQVCDYYVGNYGDQVTEENRIPVKEKGSKDGMLKCVVEDDPQSATEMKDGALKVEYKDSTYTVSGNPVDMKKFITEKSGTDVESMKTDGMKVSAVLEFTGPVSGVIVDGSSTSSGSSSKGVAVGGKSVTVDVLNTTAKELKFTAVDARWYERSRTYMIASGVLLIALGGVWGGVRASRKRRG